MAKDNRSGPRRHADSPKGSKNKSTIAGEALAEILDVDDPYMLAGASHKRGHTLLAEMERIACDPTQPISARIMAARTALPFLLPRRTAKSDDEAAFSEDLVETTRQRRNQLADLRALAIASEQTSSACAPKAGWSSLPDKYPGDAPLPPDEKTLNAHAFAAHATTTGKPCLWTLCTCSREQHERPLMKRPFAGDWAGDPETVGAGISGPVQSP